MVSIKLLRSIFFLRSMLKIQAIILIGFLFSGLVPGVLIEADSSDKFALVIGINKYENKSNASEVPDLSFAVKDAETIGDILKTKLGYKVEVLKNRFAEREDILRTYYLIKDQMGSKSEFILYFAGHGVRDNVLTAGSKGRAESYWMTYDTDFKQMEVHGIRLVDVFRLVMMLPGDRKLIILDHCYAGDLIPLSQSIQKPQPVQSNQIRNIPPTIYSDQPPKTIVLNQSYYKDLNERASINNKVWTLPAEDQAIAIIAASRDVAFEHAKLGHGLLTWSIVQALTKDIEAADAANDDLISNGTVTLQELILYVDRTTKAMKDKLRKENLEGIERQEIQFKIYMQNNAITGWPLLKIPRSYEFPPLLNFLQTARNLGLEPATYTFVKDALDKAKKQVDKDGAISEDNCEGQEIYTCLSRAKRSIDALGGVSPTNIDIIGNSLIAVMQDVKKHCEGKE